MNRGVAFYLLDGQEVAVSEDPYICCDGGEGALGHPREYMTLADDVQVRCGYCSRLYLRPDHPDVERVRREGERLADIAAAV
jgi:uncharacterized Zn-finger protein